jgi:Fibronectin type III domain
MKSNAKTQSATVPHTARRASAPSPKRRAIGLRSNARRRTARRSVADAAPPVNDGGLVKMDLSKRPDLNLLAFAENHIVEMAGNANFQRPIPTAPAFELLVEDFRLTVADFEAAKVALANASKAKDAARLSLTEGFTTRGNYVQTMSNGNALVISSSGLELRKPRTPLGQLPWPQDFRVELNGARGLMVLQWKAVPKAKGYAVRYRDVDSGEAWKEVPRTGKPKLELTNMEVKITYAFQVCALGGAGGQSLWSPEVIRAAA